MATFSSTLATIYVLFEWNSYPFIHRFFVAEIFHNIQNLFRRIGADMLFNTRCVGIRRK